MAREELKKIIEKALKSLQKSGEIGNFLVPEILIEHPKEKIRGDYATNVAFLIGKDIAKNPVEVAMILKNEIENPSFAKATEGKEKSIIEKVETIGGFVNFFISSEYFKKQLPVILKEKNKFGNLKIGKNEKINIEFISANPTGPLTLGNGRGGFCGDVLVNVLEKAGYSVKREYYINDIGNQINKLGHSVIGDAEAVYKGEYINDLRKKFEGSDFKKIGEKSAKIILDKMIKPSLKKMGIGFDIWFSEKSLYENKEVDEGIEELSKKGFTYESEGSLWFKSKDLGDDKDRVLVRADGVKTYFASDIAYLKNKFKRGFNHLIVFLGADHYGYIARLKAGAHALGYKKESVDVIVMQLVRLFEKGKEVRMSKRTGIYVTIDELINEVGLDVARFFFLTKGSNTQFNFDLDLAKEKSDKNPVFKVQYAYARICSIVKKSEIKILSSEIDFRLLKENSELNLMRKFTEFSEVIEDTTKDYQIQRMPQYATELADAFHSFYENCQVITKDKELSQARLSLVLATKIVLKNTLDLMGISSPEKM
ncbi:MAG: arginine--tRNA ligase [Candidatus Staskawiczbacteria bacterium]|nr:arginine--tRNA ligase [Candidatus Staskawiczbacteria bacterium]